MQSALLHHLKAFFSTLLLFAVVIGARAQQGTQPGYIVPAAGDTLRGIVELGRDQRNSRVCYFQPSANAAKQQYLPKQLLAYGAADLHFESHLLPESATTTDTIKQAFLEVIVRGPLTLYHFRGQAGERFFLTGYRLGQLTELPLLTTSITRRERGFDRVSRVVQHVYRDTLARAFQACPAMQRQVEQISFQLKSLEQAVRAYNTCINPVSSAPTSELKSSRRGSLQVAPMLGLGFADRLELGEGNGGRSLDQVYHGSPYATAGVSVLYTPGLQGAPFLVHADVLYEYNRRYTQVFYMPGNNRQRVDFAFDYVRLPVFLRYSYGHGLVRPYLEAGIYVQIVTVQREDKITFFYNGTESSQAVFGAPRRMGYGVGAGAGLAIGPVQGRQLQLSIRVVKGTGPSPYVTGSTLTSVATYVAFPLLKAPR